MALYNIEWRQSAQKELKKLDKQVILRILETIEGLAENPYPSDSKKLHGAVHKYRIRVGDYRIIYCVLSEIVTIEIVRIGHRKEVYRKFT